MLIVSLLDHHFSGVKHKIILPLSHSFLISAPELRRWHQTAQHILCYCVNCNSFVNKVKTHILDQTLTSIKVQNGKLLVILFSWDQDFTISCRLDLYCWNKVPCDWLSPLLKTSSMQGLLSFGYSDTRWEYWRNCLHANSLQILEAEEIWNKRHSHRNDCYVARWYKVIWKERVKIYYLPQVFSLWFEYRMCEVLGTSVGTDGGLELWFLGVGFGWVVVSSEKGTCWVPEGILVPAEFVSLEPGLCLTCTVCGFLQWHRVIWVWNCC